MKRILCPTDFSEASAAAERLAVTMARSLGSELVLLHVASETPLWRESVAMAQVRAVFEAQRKWAADTLAARCAGPAGQGVSARWLLKTGVPWQEIVQAAAAEGAEMIVMGTHGRTGLDRLLVGSVTERVVRQAPCPVLTVPPAAARQERRTS